MFLKNIEIQGFKSFARKTGLSFNEGMTAIVGPNGSGKSNIADAVRWVLGEQKVKQLRGQSMQDVIFAGTELRKPLGFAFVSMTFDNQDGSLQVPYKEVTVSRRLYRSGESEYMLNGQSVRLKDIQELFYDTGVGRDGYSIIGQGQIEAILSGKPEDRRGLFDEACGIVKFKKRKLAACKNLEEQSANLLRVTDILNELRKQIGPLERQSRGAREYLKLRDELKHLELNCFIREAKKLIEQTEEYEKNLSIINSQLGDAKDEDSRLKGLNEELSGEIEKTEEEISKLRGDIQKGGLLTGNLKNQAAVLETEIKALTEKIAAEEQRSENLSKGQKERSDTCISYYESAKKLEADLKLMSLEEDGQEAAGLLKEVKEFTERLIKLIPDKPAEDEEEPEIPDKVESAADEEPDDDDDFSFAVPDWLSQIKNKRDDLSEIKEKENRITAWLKDSQDKYNRLTEGLKALNKKLSEKNFEYNRSLSRYETLKNIQDRYDGYGQSVQSVMLRKNSVKGIKGVIADLIHTKKEYELAVETALGSRIQNVVTDNEDTARLLIEYLKKNRLGRVTFLPVSAVRGKVQDEYKRAQGEKGCLGLCSDVVSADTEYEDLCLSLLGNTLIFDNMDNALKCAAKYRHGLRIVTLEGELLSPGGAISGGAYKNNANLMGRARELGELSAQVERQKDIQEKAQRDVQECSAEIKAREQEINSLSEQLSEINNEKNSLSFGIMSDIRVKVSALKQSVDFVRENIERVEQEAFDYEKEQQSILNGIEESRSLIKEKEALIRQRNDDIEHVETELSKISVQIEQKEKELTEKKSSREGNFSRKDEISDEILSLEKDVIRIENQRDKNTQKLDSETEYILTEYGASLSDAQKDFDPELGADAKIKQQVQEKKAAVKKLGPVNVDAIDEYREVSERLKLYETQYNDITAAKSEIEKIVLELDEGMKAKFNSEFANIQKEFSEVFRELFEGGEASIELLYDDEAGENDELTAGIGITAQPPGKKLQNMMQLSGGEKALTAIALLLAIQNLKPSPFCLLDEIEAALDDTNVYRFAQYIKRMSGGTQFILITHRRGTMEAADRLYGITMQEKGVTSLVSVDLVSDGVI